MQEREIDYARLMQFSPNWEFAVNREGVFVYHSPAVKNVTGYTNEELIEDLSLFYDLVFEDDRSRLYQFITSHVRLTMIDKTALFRVVCKSGITKNVQLTVAHVFLPDHTFAGVRGSIAVVDGLVGRALLNRGVATSPQTYPSKRWLIDNFKYNYPDFHPIFKDRFPQLTDRDIDICSYLKLKMSSKEIAILLNITVPSVEVLRGRLRKKLELNREDNLMRFVDSIS